MDLVVVIIKEIIESLLRNFRLLFNKYSFPEKRELEKNGLYIKENFLSKEQCNQYIKRIDELLDSDNNVWQDELGSDKRLYFIETLDEMFNKFYINPEIRNVLAAYTGTKNPKGMLLGSRIDFIDGNLGSGGGWHRDSPVTHQFKAICYLNNVSESNGPFQYIKESHCKSKVLLSYLKNVFRAGQYRFSDKEISNYLVTMNTEVTSVIGDAGTLVCTDTKGIHRGKPIQVGSRYVLFCYFWHDKIPKHFEQLKQKV